MDFFSHLNYGLLVWGGTTASNITKLQRIQKQAVRAISDSACNAHTEPIFESLGVRPIQVVHDEKLRYYAETKTNSNFRKLSNLTLHDNSHNTRHSETWFVPYPWARTNYGKQLLCCTLPSLLLINELFAFVYLQIITDSRIFCGSPHWFL